MAAVTVHVAEFIAVRVQPNGSIIPSGTEMTIGQRSTANTEWRIVPDSSNPNTAGYPDIKTYILLEALAGLKPLIMNQTFIITG